MAAPASYNVYTNLKDMANLAVNIAIPSSVLGAVTTCVIKGTSAAAMGALFGSGAAVMFTVMLLVSIIVMSLFESKIDELISIVISAIFMPFGGWAACAAAGFVLTALEITALTVAAYVGGVLGICFILPSLS